MISVCNDLKKHAAEFLTYLRNFKYERTEEGLYFPTAKATAKGMYFHDVNGLDPQCDHNLLPDEGLTYLLATGLGNGTKITSWYLALFGGSTTVAANWTGANFAANASEITSSSEGYSEANRQIFTPGTATANTIDNLSSKAAFTIVTSSQLNVTGAGLLSNNVKGSTSGTLISATRFTSTRVLSNTDVFNLGYRVQLADS